ncbi:hypothetical protein ACMFGQ_22175 [Enterobacter hormaechei]
MDRKSGSDDETVEFELSSPADLRGQLIPTRQIQPMCTWSMRGWYKTGNGCTYAGQNGWFDKTATGWTILHRMLAPDCCQRGVNLVSERMNSWIMAGFRGFTSERIIMREKTVSAILAHAAASFPEECCGVVSRRGGWRIHPLHK